MCTEERVILHPEKRKKKHIENREIGGGENDARLFKTFLAVGADVIRLIFSSLSNDERHVYLVSNHPPCLQSVHLLRREIRNSRHPI